MRSFSTTSSIPFVGGFSIEPSVHGLGVRDYINSVTERQFHEGSAKFNELRYCLLRETEQCLIMAGNCYARGLDGLRAGSSFWSSVSFYYAAFFAAKAIMGTYGCWMGGPRSWIEVANGTVGTFQLSYRNTVYGNLKGSHKVTWDAYYDLTSRLSSFLTSPEAVIAKSPVNNMRTWLIDARNDVNYYPQVALQATEDFDASFDPTNIPNCFSGRIQTLRRVSQSFVLFAKESSLRVSLLTDIWQPHATRSAYMQKKVTSIIDPAIDAYYGSEKLKLHF